jgi:hypothetical protein
MYSPTGGFFVRSPAGQASGVFASFGLHSRQQHFHYAVNRRDTSDPQSSRLPNLMGASWQVLELKLCAARVVVPFSLVFASQMDSPFVMTSPHLP